MKQNIITISRQCGSGGHTIGKMLAERLGYEFYDKEIIKDVSIKSGLSEKTVEEKSEYSSTNSLLYNIATRGVSAYNVADKDNMLIQDMVNAYQTEYIREIAEKGSCVIVGRSADYILGDREDCFNVFICGNMEDRERRVIERHEVDAQEAKWHIISRDKKRSKYYRHITDQTWGAAENYDLCLNSSKLGVERCVEIIMNTIS